MSLRVYYLDDEQALCDNFADYFSSSETVVTTFVDPIAAIQMIRLEAPDLLFLDYRLPGTTGDEVAMAIQPTYPVFLITGDITVRTKFKFARVFSKPTDEQIIASVINSYRRKPS